MGVFRRQTKSLHDVCFVSTAFNSCFPDFSFVVILSKPLELQQRRLDLYNEDFIVLWKVNKESFFGVQILKGLFIVSRE